MIINLSFAIYLQILSIMSYIGSSLSIIGLVLTIITYALFRNLNRDHSGKILLNLCVSLFLMDIVFLSSSSDMFEKRTFAPKRIDYCTIIALFLHYLVLTSLSW